MAMSSKRFYASALHFNTEWSYKQYMKKNKWPKGLKRKMILWQNVGFATKTNH